MSEIDRVNQMISYYPIPRKSMRWYVKVLSHVMDICLWNGNHLFNINVKNMPHLEFRRKVASQSVGHTTTLTPSPSTRIKNIHALKKVDTRKRCSLPYKENPEKYSIRM